MCIMNDSVIHRFEIWQADLPAIPGGHIQHGIRPVVIVSNDASNCYSSVATIVPLTTKFSKMHLPTLVTILNSGLHSTSLALCEQIITIDKDRLTNYIGYVSDSDDREALELAIAIQLGLAVV